MKKPHKCPVCGGRGLVPWQFYQLYYNQEGTASNNYGATTDCRSCQGTGIVWEIVPSKPESVATYLSYTFNGEKYEG